MWFVAPFNVWSAVVVLGTCSYFCEGEDVPPTTSIPSDWMEFDKIQNLSELYQYYNVGNESTADVVTPSDDYAEEIIGNMTTLIGGVRHDLGGVRQILEGVRQDLQNLISVLLTGKGSPDSGVNISSPSLPKPPPITTKPTMPKKPNAGDPCACDVGCASILTTNNPPCECQCSSFHDATTPRGGRGLFDSFEESLSV